jgi:hypothetical protein
MPATSSSRTAGPQPQAAVAGPAIALRQVSSRLASIREALPIVRRDADGGLFHFDLRALVHGLQSRFYLVNTKVNRGQP